MTTVLRNAQSIRRHEGKERSQERILQAATASLLREGLEGAAIARIMRQAGLTHGAFYAHFPDKSALVRACFHRALEGNRLRWIGRPRPESFASRLKRLGARYLTVAHRDSLETSCAFAALASQAPRTGEEFRRLYEEELRRTLAAVLDDGSGQADDSRRRSRALAFLALCVGGIQLARAVADPEFSREILDACCNALAPDRTGRAPAAAGEPS